MIPERTINLFLDIWIAVNLFHQFSHYLVHRNSNTSYRHDQCKPRICLEPFVYGISHAYKNKDVGNDFKSHGRIAQILIHGLFLFGHALNIHKKKEVVPFTVHLAVSSIKIYFGVSHIYSGNKMSANTRYIGYLIPKGSHRVS